MQRYFAEFEFRCSNDEGSWYWMPVIVNATSLRRADEAYGKVEKALQTKFELTRRSEVRQYRPSLFSEALAGVAKTRRIAEILKLDLHKLEFSGFARHLGWRLNQPVHIVPQTLLTEYTHTIESHLERGQFLTTQVSTDADLAKDFLVLKVFGGMASQDTKA